MASFPLRGKPISFGSVSCLCDFFGSAWRDRCTEERSDVLGLRAQDVVDGAVGGLKGSFPELLDFNVDPGWISPCLLIWGASLFC